MHNPCNNWNHRYIQTIFSVMYETGWIARCQSSEKNLDGLQMTNKADLSQVSAIWTTPQDGNGQHNWQAIWCHTSPLTWGGGGKHPVALHPFQEGDEWSIPGWVWGTVPKLCVGILAWCVQRWQALCIKHHHACLIWLCFVWGWWGTVQWYAASHGYTFLQCPHDHVVEVKS